MRWIIGDIHGMLRPLEALLGLIRSVDDRARLFFVGDYVNRGPDSARVVDLLLGLGPAARFVRGNHDDIFDQVLHGACYAPNPTGRDRVEAFRWFMQHGLANTLTSYGLDYAELEHLMDHPDARRLDALLRAVPEAHRAFFRNLPPVAEEDEFFVAHGKWDPDDRTGGRPMAEALDSDPRRRERLLWGRFADEEILRVKVWDRTGYFGHTPVDLYPALLPELEPVPVTGPKVVLLDTGAALSARGRLTAVCHEARTYHQADRSGRLITAGAGGGG